MNDDGADDREGVTMIKAIGATLAGLVALLTLAAPAQAITYGQTPCVPGSQPLPVVRVEKSGDDVVIGRTWVTTTRSHCDATLGKWVITRVHIHEWKRYGREVPGGYACTFWARNRYPLAVDDRWGKWHHVASLDATNC